MHSIAEVGTNVPAFLGKLWKMVEDPVTNDLISWSSNGTSFIIKDEIRFARDLLPMYYKHNNMASFIRQLNMYGFHKLVSPEAGSMKMESPEEIQFMHPFFMRGHPYLLDSIKRKINTGKVATGGEKTPQVITKVLSDVKQMKGRQDNMDGRLVAMKLENEALWRELSVLRQKHIKQQQIVNKLIQFLVTVVQQNQSNFSVKRKFPRMLQHEGKLSKKYHEEEQPHTPGGPVIHELDPAEALLETVVEEAVADTPTEESPEFLLDQSLDDDDDCIVEMPSSVEDLISTEDTKPEPVIRIPEIIEVPQMKRDPRTSSRNQNKPNIRAIYIPKNTQKETVLLKPPYVKLIQANGNKSKINIENQKPIKLIIKPKPTENSLLQSTTGQSSNVRPQINRVEIKRQEAKTDVNKRKQQPQRVQLIKSSQRQPIVVNVRSDGQTRQIQNNAAKRQTPASSGQPIVVQRLQIPKVEPTETVVTMPQNNDNDLMEVAVDPLQLDDLPVETMTQVTQDFPLVEEPLTTVSSGSDQMQMAQDLLVESPVVVNDIVMTPQPAGPVVTPVAVSPTTPASTSAPSPASTSAANMQVANVPSSPNLVSRSGNILSEMDNHLDSMQSDLDNLKELLRSEGISLDANALLGYLNEDPLSYNISDSLPQDDPNRVKENSGNELMAYNPSLYDLADLGLDWSLPNVEETDNVDEMFQEVNTPQFVPQSPSFPTPSKKRKT